MNLIQLLKMNKIAVTFVASLLFWSAYGQDFTPMKSPDVTSFVNANYLPINESTGRADVTIPLYTMNLDGLQIPISISYNTSGVKVDATASIVGLNWTLNAGGVVNKEIQGQEDIFVKGSSNENSSTNFAYYGYGFLRNTLNFSNDPNHPVVEPYRDFQPDHYYVIAPGLTTKFTHKSTGEPFEISNQGTKIYTPFNDANYLIDPYYRFKLKPGFKFELTPINGFIYSFQDVGLHYIFNRSHSSTTLAPMFSLDLTVSELEESIFPGPILTRGTEQLPDLFPTVHLTNITNPISKRSITYKYLDYNIIDNDRRINRKYQLNNGSAVNSTLFDHDFTKEKAISKILFPNGTVDFYYDDSRLDVRGGKILKKIEVRNNLGELIRGIIFEQDYFNSVENCTDNHCYRLRLNAVKFVDKNNAVLPGYSFDYNTTKLPKRFSNSKDFTGYYNNATGTIPKVYFKANQGKNSFLPFPMSGYATNAYGNLDKTASLLYTKAAVLEKITYPTGGYTTFDYQLNSFRFLNTTIQGGGLRVASQNLFDSNSTLEKSISYLYELENGNSSGSITNIPNFVEIANIAGGSTLSLVRLISQTVNSKLELTNGAFVNYSRVKIAEANNGYTINEYTNALDNPNEYPVGYTTSESNTGFVTNVNDGLYPTIYKDFSIKRGALLSSKVYNEQGVLLRKVTNEYEYTDYANFQISEKVIFRNPNLQFTIGNNAGHGTFNSSLNLESNLIKRTVTENHESSGVVITEQNYVYDSELPLIKESSSVIDAGDIRKQHHYYPFDPEVANLPQMDALRDLNILVPTKKEYFKNSTLLKTSQTDYANFGSNKILPISEKLAKGSNPLEVRQSYERYDKRGNLIEYKKEDGILISVLWGYDYQHKIAEILNAEYADVLQALGVSHIDYLQTMTNTTLEAELSQLRTSLGNAQIYSYIHTPAVGAKTITDPKGLKSNFTYDSHKRLLNVKDHNGFLVSQNTYNYKLNPSVDLPAEETLSLQISKSKSPDYYLPVQNPSNQYTVLSAIVKGGRGDYSYEWSLTGSSTILSRAYKLAAKVLCNTSNSYDVKVTDSNGTVLTESVTVDAPNCGEPFYVGAIEGSSTTNNQNDFWVNTDGGSYGSIRYRWFISGGPLVGNTILYDNNVYPQSSGLLFNNTGSPVTVNLSVEVLDIESGFSVIRTRSVVIQPEFEPPSCFIKGTMITMSDGTLKPIEKVSVGDLIQTFNTDTKKIEPAEVEELVSPLHSQLVVLEFDNGISNTNTYDHPYYIKNKGWCSYNPMMTSMNYGFEVEKMEVGDIMLYHNPKDTSVKEIRLQKLSSISKSQTTYNLFKVGKNHNFFANGVLVHNKYNQDN